MTTKRVGQPKTDANFKAFVKRKKEINEKAKSVFGSLDKFEKWLSTEKKNIDSVRSINAVEKLITSPSFKNK